MLRRGPAWLPRPPDAQTAPAPQPQPLPPGPPYDKGLFVDPLPAAETAFLAQAAGAPSGAVYNDRLFKAILRAGVPDCIFHYGRDMSFRDALDLVMPGSLAPVQVRDNRYALLASHRGPYLAGRAFLWVDLEDGLVLGGFYFHPTNGEPTPTLAIFSRQVKIRDKVLETSQLPPEFVRDMDEWSAENGIAPVTTRYFITGTNLRILLEHSEDYCADGNGWPGAPAPPPDECEEMNAEAADLDMDAAYYLEQVNYATNATAWMMTGGDQQEWLVVRANTCAAAADPLACRIRMTRVRTRVIVTRKPMPRLQR